MHKIKAAEMGKQRPVRACDAIETCSARSRAPLRRAHRASAQNFLPHSVNASCALLECHRRALPAARERAEIRGWQPCGASCSP